MNSLGIKKLFLFGFLAFIGGFIFSFDAGNAFAYIYDTKTCYVSGYDSCSNPTAGDGYGSHFTHYHRHTIDGGSSTMDYVSQTWDPGTVYSGEPYYSWSWTTDGTRSPQYWGKDYAGTKLTEVGMINIGMSSAYTQGYTGQSTLRIVSDLMAAANNQAEVYEIITYPRHY